MQVQSSQLKWDPTGHPLWFNGSDEDLYIVIGEFEIRHFEVSYDESLFSGGASKALQYGKIKAGESSRIDLSRVVNYQSDIPIEELNKAIEIVKSCQNLEPQLKQGLISYFNGFSFGHNPLRFNEPLKSYLPIEKRELKPPPVSLRKRYNNFKKKLPEHFGVKTVLFLCVVGAIFGYFSSKTSKNMQFLEMDERLGVRYVQKYIKEDGDIFVTDGQSKNILHHMSEHMFTVKDDQFQAFKYLVKEKGMDPNSFDINGRTPLYYVIWTYLNPPDSDDPDTVSYRNFEGVHFVDKEQFEDKILEVIKELIKLGADPRAKKSEEYLSVWEVAKQDPNLRSIMEK